MESNTPTSGATLVPPGEFQKKSLNLIEASKNGL